VRRRLGLVALAVAGLIVIAFSVPLGVLVAELARDRALAGAERDAQLIAVVATSAEGDPSVIRNVIGTGQLNGNDVTVVLADGTVLGAPLQEGEDLTPVTEGATGRRPLEGGQAVYAPAIDAEGISVVRVFIDDATLTRGVARAWMLLGLLGLAMIAIAALIASRLARTIVEPVERLSAASQRLGAGDLDTRVVPGGPPEITEVGAEFNRLAEQVSQLLEKERETAADISHRLRTPLAAVGLDAERLPAGPERERLLDDLAELQRAVDFVIREVRRPGRPGGDAATDLVALLAERAAFWEALAEEQARATTVRLPEDARPMVPVSPTDLEAAIDAVIGNVFSHTGEGVAYAISCETSDGQAKVVVDDAGEGLAEADVERGKSGGGSTGLGLDIARRTTQATGGSLSITPSPLGGARVTLVFGGVTE
jgi:signal transduction histidine kinase